MMRRPIFRPHYVNIHNKGALRAAVIGFEDSSNISYFSISVSTTTITSSTASTGIHGGGFCLSIESSNLRNSDDTLLISRSIKRIQLNISFFSDSVPSSSSTDGLSSTRAGVHIEDSTAGMLIVLTSVH